jgi:hypothetical protein
MRLSETSHEEPLITGVSNLELTGAERGFDLARLGPVSA